MYTLFLFSVIGFTFVSSIDRNRPDEGANWSDVGLTPTDLIEQYQYPVEQHHVPTKDGYHLSVQRIPYGRMCTDGEIKGPIILSTGVLLNSVTWIFAGTKNGLGYILADSCYDVWLMNQRGTTLTSGKSSSSISDLRYWDFSFHEMGEFDQPAVVDYVLNITGADTVTYIGFYEGATIFFVFLSLHPEYNNKVKAAFLLAPPPMSVNPSAVSQQTVIRNPLQVVTDIFRAYTKMRQKRLQNLVWDVFCGSLRAVNPFVCETLAIYPVPGYDHPESNMTLLNLSVRHRIFGTTVKDLTHSGQIITSGMFRQYDYGPNKNMDEYGQASPPEYDIKNILVPMHFFTAKNDEAVIREGAERFRNVSDIYVVPNQKFNYMDHIIANNIINLEYEYLVRMIDSYHI